MATLHWVNTAPATADALLRCLAASTAGDAIVLYEAGVLGAVDLRAESLPPGVALFIHRRDAHALHVADLIDPAFGLIDDRQLVSLVVAFERSVSWI